MASDLLAKGRTKVKGLYSEKKDKTYDADVVLIDSNDKYVHFRLDLTESEVDIWQIQKAHQIFTWPLMLPILENITRDI